MKRFQTKGIILRRTDYGEADRIINFLTPDHGKVSAMAKGVRRPKSKLAGGIELFSISSITLLKGRGGLDRLISTRLDTHYGNIVKDYDSMEVGYRGIAMINTITEDEAEQVYFDLLQHLFELLEAKKVSLATIESWFYLQLLGAHGYLPNLTHLENGDPLTEDMQYNFDHTTGGFTAVTQGLFAPNDIKAWRVMSQIEPGQLQRISGLSDSTERSHAVLRRFAEHHLS